MTRRIFFGLAIGLALLPASALAAKTVSFNSPRVYPAGPDPLQEVTADFSSYGHPDPAVVNERPAWSAGDLNGHGKPDVVATFENGLAVLLNTGE